MPPCRFMIRGVGPGREDLRTSSSVIASGSSARMRSSSAGSTASARSTACCRAPAARSRPGCRSGRVAHPVDGERGEDREDGAQAAQASASVRPSMHRTNPRDHAVDRRARKRGRAVRHADVERVPGGGDGEHQRAERPGRDRPEVVEGLHAVRPALAHRRVDVERRDAAPGRIILGEEPLAGARRTGTATSGSTRRARGSSAGTASARLIRAVSACTSCASSRRPMPSGTGWATRNEARNWPNVRRGSAPKSVARVHDRCHRELPSCGAPAGARPRAATAPAAGSRGRHR